MIYVEKMADISGGGDPVLKWDYIYNIFRIFYIHSTPMLNSITFDKY